MKRKQARAKPIAGGVTVRIVRLTHGQGLALPEYQSAGAAGLDLVAAVPDSRPLKLRRREYALVPTGLTLALPDGYEAQVRPRSGLAAKHGVTVLNSPGTIDSDYRGEVKVLLINLGSEAVKIRRGERIAQLVVAPVSRARLVMAEVLEATQRGAGGFGSTGSTSDQAGAAAAVEKRAKSKAVPRRGEPKKRNALRPARNGRG